MHYLFLSEAGLKAPLTGAIEKHSGKKAKKAKKTKDKGLMSEGNKTSGDSVKKAKANDTAKKGKKAGDRYK